MVQQLECLARHLLCSVLKMKGAAGCAVRIVTAEAATSDFPFSVDQPLLRSLLCGHDGALRLVHLRADADNRPLHPRLPGPAEVTGGNLET